MPTFGYVIGCMRAAQFLADNPQNKGRVNGIICHFVTHMHKFYVPIMAMDGFYIQIRIYLLCDVLFIHEYFLICNKHNAITKVSYITK